MPLSTTTPWRARISALAADREQGASVIALQAAQALAEGVAGGAPAKPLLGALVELVHGQRSMAAVLRLAADLSVELKSGAVEKFSDVALRWVGELESAQLGFQEALLRDVSRGGAWGFHSLSSTVLNGLETLAKADILGNAWVSESRPGGEGSQTARRLHNLGWKTTFVPDTLLLDLVSRGELDMVVLGCDAADGERFINKVGSGALAATAHGAGVMCEIWTTTHKLVPAGTLSLLNIGETQASELRPPAKEIRIDQPLFGTGNMDHADALRTERGRMRPADVADFLDGLPALDTSMLELEASP